MKLYRTLIIGFAFLIIFNGCASKQTGEDTKIKETLKQIESEDINIRTQAASTVLKEGMDLEKEIIQLTEKYVKNGSRRGTAKTLINLLGDMKSTEAVPVLVENITLEVFYKEVKRPQTIQDRFPCVNALIKIGKPSLDPILKKVSETDEDKAYFCSANVFKVILGKNDAVSYIEDYIKNRNDATVTKRLRVLIKNI